MYDARLTPTPQPDPDLAWLIRQHEHDLAVIEAQADRIARLEADQAALILQSRRDERKKH